MKQTPNGSPASVVCHLCEKSQKRGLEGSQFCDECNYDVCFSCVPVTSCKICCIERTYSPIREKEVLSILNQIDEQLSSHPRRFDQLMKTEGPKKEDATWLYVASRNGYGKVVSHLMQNGADPRTKIEMGSTCLHAASFYNHRQCVEAIRDKCSSELWNDLLKITNCYGITPVQEGKTDV